MKARLNAYTAAPETMKAVAAIEPVIAASGLEASLIENVARLVYRIHAVFDVYVEHCGLILRVGRTHVGPDEFKVLVTHAILDDAVDEALYPAGERRQPLFEGSLLRGLCGRTVLLPDKGIGGQ